MDNPVVEVVLGGCAVVLVVCLIGAALTYLPRRDDQAGSLVCCSFCDKSQRQVGKLIRGAGDIYICNECVDLCENILDEEEFEPEPPKHRVWAAAPGEPAAPVWPSASKLTETTYMDSYGR